MNRSPLRAGEMAMKYSGKFLKWGICKLAQKLIVLTHLNNLGSGILPNLATEDPRDVAQLLLRYLGELPEPLCTFVLYEDFVRCEGFYFLLLFF